MNKDSYYKQKLSANKLLKCYEVAPPRIKQYLNAEIQFVISNIQDASLVLELGCGYGRIMKAVSQFCSTIIGNDISKETLQLTRSYMNKCRNYDTFLMDASQMAFRSGIFDTVFCIQNGISALEANRKALIAESIRVTKSDGIILFSSYSSKIWESRLQWFRKQSQFDLIGEIDEDNTRNGTIACKDGFKATTVSGDEFIELFNNFGCKASIIEVDESNVFCRVIKDTELVHKT